MMSKPLVALIVSRDIGLVCLSFYMRYRTLPPPRTLSRYFNVSVAPAEIRPTTISKLNTALQLTLVCASVAAPVFSFVDHPALQALAVAVAATTIISGLGYVRFDKSIVWGKKP